MIRADDVLFWILMFVIIGVSIWLGFGSPDFESSLLMLTVFVAGSEILLWRSLFAKDKKVAVGFEKVRGDFRVMDGRLGNIEDRLVGIEKSVGVIRDSLIGRKKFN